MIKQFVITACFFFILSGTWAQGNENYEALISEKQPFDLVYKTIGVDSLKLTFRYPSAYQKSKKYPTIIFFFGGGWNGGSVTQFEPHAAYFAERGMITVLADYRVKSRQGTTPYEAVNDAKSAVRFLRTHASELHIDPNKIVASGGSAGGHLAAATGNLPGLDEPEEDLNISSKANALVLFNPVFDNGPTGFEHERMGDRWAEISPVHNLTKGAPPTIIFLGTEDHLIPVSIAENYKAKMDALGSRCELHLYEGEGHGFFNKSNNEGLNYIDTVRKTDFFLISLKYLEGEPSI